MNLRAIARKYFGWCPGFKAAVDLEKKKQSSKLEIFPVVVVSTLAIMAYLLLAKENANVPGVVVAITLCGVIVYFNWAAYRRDGQRPYEPVKMPFRKGEFESNREPEETFDWDSLNRYRDNLGAPWALEYFGNPSNEELQKMTTKFKEFLVVCRRSSALNLTLKQIAEEREIMPLDVARMFNEEQQKFLVDKAQVSRRLMDQLMGENYRNVSGTEFLEVGGLGGSSKWPKFSDRFQELRKKQISLEKEIVDYVYQIIGSPSDHLEVS
ncbi:MAG: hypothetical protein ACXAAN_16885 [Candidatus Thorarchaeota archaeon]|jgi:hypothetical protein